MPTGNFGDILAGYYALNLGIPIKVCPNTIFPFLLPPSPTSSCVQKLVVATNKNDILDRFFQTGKYERFSEAFATLSPAMDIQISSNFERYLEQFPLNDLSELSF